MRASGIIRRIDDLGRVLIPKEIRRTMHLKEGDPLEIFVGSDGVTFSRYNPVITVKSSLAYLKEVLQDETELKHKLEMLEKVNELEAILKAEQADFEGENAI